MYGNLYRSKRKMQYFLLFWWFRSIFFNMRMVVYFTVQSASALYIKHPRVLSRQPLLPIPLSRWRSSHCHIVQWSPQFKQRNEQNKPTFVQPYFPLQFVLHLQSLFFFFFRHRKLYSAFVLIVFMSVMLLLFLFQPHAIRCFYRYDILNFLEVWRFCFTRRSHLHNYFCECLLLDAVWDRVFNESISPIWCLLSPLWFCKRIKTIITMHMHSKWTVLKPLKYSQI